MRHFYLTILLASSFAAQLPAGDTLAIGNYRVLETRHISPTHYSVTYGASLLNPGGALAAVSATVTSLEPSVRVSQGTLNFFPLAAHSRTPSAGTFTLVVDRRVPFDLAKLRWTFQSSPAPPIANAGRDQTVRLGRTVRLHGTDSTNPSGAGSLTYRWSLTAVPEGSAAKLSDPASVSPTFIADLPGTYTAALTISNGVDSSLATVSVHGRNTPPVSHAGRNQTVHAGASVILNGSRSSDIDGHALTYAWTLLDRPAESAATLAGSDGVAPTFTADKPGTYLAQLIVSDGITSSDPATVAIVTDNTAPVANAGAAQTVNAGTLVQLNGAGSTDVDGDLLTHHWSLISTPSGSAARLSAAADVNPVFIADRAGTYVAQLIVNDGQVNSAPATVTISTDSAAAPAADAGPNQTAPEGGVVTLTGGGIDSQSLPLTYRWALISHPDDSHAALSDPSAANPTFIVDKPGNYVAQLIVDNGQTDSAPETVTITTGNTAPVADPGSDRSVSPGAAVQLDGSASSDADRNSLSYHWSILSRPSGSHAALTGGDTVAPAFVADVPGTYVAQLIVNDGVVNSLPRTVTSQAVAQGITLSPNPLNLIDVGTGTLTVGIPGPAGTGGQVVNLFSFDPTVVTVPQSVTVPENASSVDVQVTPVGAGSAFVFGTAPGFQPGSTTVNVTVPAITVTLDSGFVTVGRSINGTVTLSAPAQAGGATINLGTNPGGIAAVPASILIPGGSVTGVFTVTGSMAGSALVVGSSPGFTSGSAGVVVTAPGQIILPQNVSVGINQSVSYPVSLGFPAPAGGVTVTLTSSDPTKVTISSPTVTIVARATTPTTQPQVTGVGFGSATISASAQGYTTDTETVRVGATLSFTPSSLTFGTTVSQTLTLNLSSPAPAGLTVNLSSDNPNVAIVPSGVTFPINAVSVTVPVTNISAGSTVIRASAPNLGETTASVSVLSAGTIVLPANVVVGVGQAMVFPVTLAGPAPASGVIIRLSSGDNSRVTLSTSSVFIAGGATAPANQPMVMGVRLGSAVITASAPGFTASSQPVQVGAALTFAPPSLAIMGPGTQNLTLNLSGSAPAGLVVNLTSSNPAVATVPASVTFAAGATSATVPVTAAGAGSTSIVASSSVANVTNATAAVSVTGVFIAGSIMLQPGVTVGPGQSAPFPVTLSSPAAAGGVTVALTSNDPSVTVTPSAFVSAGSTSPNVQPMVSGINFGTATISASASNYNSASQTVQVGAVLSFSPPSVTVNITGTQTLSLTLSAPAPANGLTVNLASSNPSLATVPASVTIAPNLTSANFPVTGIAAGTATITASTNIPTVANASAGVTVTAADILLPTGVIVAPGQQVPFPVTLATPAPAQGVFAIVLSGDNSKATVSPVLIFFPGGATTSTARVQVTGVSAGTASITVSASGLTGDTETVQVATQVSFSPASLTISGTGNTQSLFLSMGIPAPAGGLTVNVSSSNPGVATVPATVSFQPNSFTVSVPVTSVGGGSTVIHAGGPGVTDAAATVLVMASSGTIGLPPNQSVNIGQSIPFPVILGAPAGSGGVTITLASSDPTKVAVSTGSVFIPQGASAPATQPQITGVNIGSVTISASASGYTTATQAVQGRAVVGFSPPSLTIVGTGTQSVTLTLASAVPASGLVVNLSSDNPSVATVQSTAAFNGSSNVTITITGIAPGTAVIHAGAAPFIADTTLTVTVVGPGAINLPAGVTLGPTQSAPFPVTLSTPAPPGGVTVTLTSSDNSKVTISPGTVSIAAGSIAPATQPQISGVNFGSAMIGASAPNYAPASQTVQVNGGLSFSPQNSTINGIVTQNLSLGLSVPAPTALTIGLSSSNPGVASVPSSVMIAAGAISVPVPVTGVSSGSTVITAAAAIPNITSATANVSVAVVMPGTISLPANLSLAPNQSIAFPVTLSSPAPAGGVTVSLSSGDPSATVTPSVSILAGAITPAIQPVVSGVNFGTAAITASAPGYASASQTVQVVGTLSFQPATLNLASPGTGNLALNLTAPAPLSGLTVTLNSSSPGVASVPASVSFGPNAVSVNVPVTGITGGTVTISASGNAPNVTGAVANVVVSSRGIILPSGLTLLPGQSQRIQVMLAQPAPSGGVFISLSSGNTSKLTISLDTVLVPEGATVATAQPLLTAIDFGSATISASALGLTGDTETVVIGAQIGFSPASLTITGAGATQSLVLNLAAPAPAGGLTVNLSSTNTAVATVPATLTFAPNTLSLTVPVTSVGAGSTTIHAMALPSLPDTTAVVSVVIGSGISLPASLNIQAGQQVTFPVTLGTPAPAGGLTVTLTSSDSTIIGVSPVSVFIPAGATVPFVQPQLTGLTIGAATISASAPGFAGATTNVQANAVVAFSPTAITLAAGSSQRVVLTLSPGAGGGGAACAGCSVTVNLSSDDPSVAQAKQSVTFFPDVSFQAGNQLFITAIAPGTTVIHAGAPPFIPDTTLTVTVTN